MPRVSRFVAPGVAHHITQRGTGRQTVFRTRADRRVYLDLLRRESRYAGLSLLACCLMPNHIHLIAVPPDEDVLAVVLRRVHGRYAQYFNARNGLRGHLWQNRFFSCALGPGHLWAALRYVELNPVRAGLAAAPERIEWSSAQAHLCGQDRHRLLDMGFWSEEGGAQHWRDLLGQPDPEKLYEVLRKSTHAGQPFGSASFTEQIRALQRRSPGAGSESEFVEAPVPQTQSAGR